MDFGTEPPEIVKLFKSDYGQEPEIWEELEKGLLDRINANKAAANPASVAAPVPEAPTTPHPVSTGGSTAARQAAIQKQPDPTQPKPVHPAVQQAVNNMGQLGVKVEDNMPTNYGPLIRSTVINNAANGVKFLHSQFPGMQQAYQKHGMTYNFRGPQSIDGKRLMGQYHEPGSQGNPGTEHRVDLNATAEQTLWHEHGHFMDKIMGPGGKGVLSSGQESHPLHGFVNELMNHPTYLAGRRAEEARFTDSTGRNITDLEAANHHMYRHTPEEVFARFFNSHMNHLYSRHNPNNEPTSEPYNPVENEGWTPEHHDYFGPKLRDILRQHALTRSFAEYLDNLSKALEETRQGRPLPGTQRATRMPQGYKIPRKITRPGVRGSTLWWYDEKGNVRYGPKPVQKGPPKDEPQHVKDYLQSERPWSFMSAYSESRPTEQNDQLHAQLGKELQANPDYEIYPSRGYYTDEQGQLREEPSYLVMGMTTKSALPIGQKYGQDTVLTHHGMFNVNQRTLAPISSKRVESTDLPKDVPQTVVLTQPNHVTIVVQTGQPVPFGPTSSGA